MDIWSTVQIKIDEITTSNGAEICRLLILFICISPCYCMITFLTSEFYNQDSRYVVAAQTIQIKRSLCKFEFGSISQFSNIAIN